MVRYPIIAISLGFLAGLTCGCQTAAPPSNSVPRLVRVADRDAFFNETLTLLREKDFPPRRVDREGGVAVAGPTTSGQWFEFWRSDSRGPRQSLESSLHTIRRTVTVKLAADSAASSSDRGGTYQLSVEVEKERYSAPERQLTTPIGALAIYSDKLPTEEGLRAARTYGEHWVPIGRDPLLEEYLLEQITERAGVVDAGNAPMVSPAAPASRSAPPAVPPTTSANTAQPTTPAPAPIRSSGGMIIRDVPPSQ